MIAIAWAAGLFEGEGSISITHGGKGSARRYVKLQLASTDEDVVERFRHVVGAGSVCRRETAHKPQWQWASSGVEAERILAAFAPYLGERRTTRMREVLDAIS